MTQADMQGQEQGQSFVDYLIAFLGAITYGGAAWAVGYGLVEGARFAISYFEIALPTDGLVAAGIAVGFFAFPILLGLLTAWRSYRKLMTLA